MRGVHEEPSRVADVTRADMVPLTGCDEYFNWKSDHFEGAIDRGACAFPAPGVEDGPDIYSWPQMHVTETVFVYLDGWFNLDGSYYLHMTEDWFL